MYHGLLTSPGGKRTTSALVGFEKHCIRMAEVERIQPRHDMKIHGLMASSRIYEKLASLADCV